jgi:L-fuconolactonase
MTEDPIRAALRKHPPTRLDWLSLRTEQILEPALPIIDAHHHVWNQPANRYMFEDVLADFQCGHNVIASVGVQAHSMYRADGPEELKPVGETEFLNGLAAQSASGDYGRTRLCAGIVAAADITLGADVDRVLEAHLRSGGDRLRGIRPTTAWHESSEVRGLDIPEHLLESAAAREAIRCIARRGLSLDLWLFFTQLDEALAICRAFPDLTVVINHVGGPLGTGPYRGRRDEMFPAWLSRVQALAQCPNALMKLGGLGMRYAGFDFHTQALPPSSDLLADTWRPYVHACIAAFGADRCMFESNFPVDRAMYSYHVLWNAFKKLAAGCSVAEKDALFRGCAARAYRLSIEP